MYDREHCKITVKDGGITAVYDNTVAAENALRDVIAAEVIVEDIEEVPPYIFGGKQGIVHITFGDGVVKIAPAACSACRNLKSVCFAESVVSIGEVAFSRSGIEVFEAGQGLRIIGRGACFGCPDLKEIVLNKYLVLVGEMAFAFCPKLSSLVLEIRQSCSVSANAFHGSLNNYGVRAYIASAFGGTNKKVVSGDTTLHRRPYVQRKMKLKGKEKERLENILNLKKTRKPSK